MYAYKVQKDDHEINNSGIKKAKGVKKSASKELTFDYFGKYVHEVTNTPIVKKNKQALEA